MKIVTYLDNLKDVTSDVVTDVILSSKELSRTGEINLSELESLADKCWKNGIRPILEWDILMTEDLFSKARENLEKIDLNKFFAIRVQDPGAINYILESHPELKIQLILETANHNFKSIETWIDFIGKRLERVILSIEIPKDILEVYLNRLKDLDVKSEFLGLGKVLLFYTPRSLLAPLAGSQGEKVEALATGEETPHKNFPVMENSHGTFMYNTKDHFLIDHLKELKDMGLSFLRLDLRGSNPLILFKISQLMKNHDAKLIEEIKNLYPRKIGKGFYKANKTDVLFKKLKNKNLGKGHGHYLGDVIDVRKKKLMGIQFKTPGVDLHPGDYLEIRTPEGRVKNIQVKEMLDSNLKPMDKAHSGKVFFMSHVGGVSVRSRIFKEDRT